MGTNVDNRFARGNVSGNASVPRLSSPQVRGAVRRKDPDGSHAQPYWSGLSGTALGIEVGTIDGGVIVAIDVNFASDNYAAAVAAVNAASPGNFQWLESDGFPCVQSLHSGAKNYIKVTEGNAATVFGMSVFPAPGSFSRAGDIAPAPADRIQQNPSTTELLARDENLSTSAINRAIVGSLQGVDQALADLDREVAVWRTVQFTVTFGSIGNNLLQATDLSGTTNLRIHSGAIAQALADGFSLNDIIQLLDGTRKLIYVTVNGIPQKVTVTDVMYGGLSQTGGTGAITWGTSGGVQIYTTAAFQSLKHAATPITAIRGATLFVSGATFLTNHIQPGDHIVITGATNNVPFNHNGEFVVIDVPDEEHLVLRSLGYTEEKIVASNDSPPALNAVGATGSFGSVSVYIGTGFPFGGKTQSGSDSLHLGMSTTLLTGGSFVWVRLPLAMTLREAISNGFLELANPIDGQIAYKNLANVFTLRNEFDQGIKIPALPFGGFAPNSEPRLDMPLGGNDPLFVPIIESSGVDIFGANYPMRLYFNRTSGGISLAVNTKYNSSSNVWSKDVNGSAAFRTDIRQTGIKFYQQSATDNTSITGDAWPEVPVNLQIPFLASTSSGATARLQLQPTNEGSGTLRLTLLAESKTVLSAQTTRIYVDAVSGGLVVTNNAVWNWATQTWSKDNAGSTAIRIGFGTSGMSSKGRAAASTGTWNDSSWDGTYSFTTDVNGGSGIRGSLGFSAIPGSPNVPALSFDGTTNSPNYQLISQVTSTSALTIRTYARPNGGVLITSNCRWSGTTWVSDSTGGNAVFYFGSVIRSYYNLTDTSWTDDLTVSGWDGRIFETDTDGLHVVSSLLELGSQLVTSAALARTARISGKTAGTTEGSALKLTLLQEWAPANAGDTYTRVYAGDTYREIRFIVNARWDGTNWIQDNAAFPSYSYSFGNRFMIRMKSAGASPWPDTWTTTLLDMNTNTGSTIMKSVGGDDPVLGISDYGGNLRSVHDHIGYRGGRISEFQELWLAVPPSNITGASGPALLANNPKWVYQQTANTELLPWADGNTYQGNLLLLTPGTASTNFCILSLTGSPFTTVATASTLGKLSAVFEFELFPISSGIDSTWTIGLTDNVSSTGAFSPFNGFHFQSVANANWKAFNSRTGTLSALADCAVAPAAYTPQRFRIEVHGPDTPYGACARYAIDDIVRATVTAQFPTSLLTLFIHGRGAPSNPAKMNVGAISFRINRWANGSIL